MTLIEYVFWGIPLLLMGAYIARAGRSFWIFVLMSVVVNGIMAYAVVRHLTGERGEYFGAVIPISLQVLIPVLVLFFLHYLYRNASWAWLVKEQIFFDAGKVGSVMGAVGFGVGAFIGYGLPQLVPAAFSILLLPCFQLAGRQPPGRLKFFHWSAYFLFPFLAVAILGETWLCYNNSDPATLAMVAKGRLSLVTLLLLYFQANLMKHGLLSKEGYRRLFKFWIGVNVGSYILVYPSWAGMLPWISPFTNIVGGAAFTVNAAILPFCMGLVLWERTQSK